MVMNRKHCVFHDWGLGFHAAQTRVASCPGLH
jgi:hypothetical protein